MLPPLSYILADVFPIHDHVPCSPLSPRCHSPRFPPRPESLLRALSSCHRPQEMRQPMATDHSRLWMEKSRRWNPMKSSNYNPSA